MFNYEINKYIKIVSTALQPALVKSNGDLADTSLGV